MSTTFRLMSAISASALALMVGSSAFGQAQSKDQQKCINTLNKDTCKVAATQGKENSGCVKSGTKGTATSGCLTADSKGKVAKTETKTTSDETKNACLGANAPNYGYAGGAAGNSASTSQEVNLFSDTYGTTDPSAVISTDKTIGKCQSAVTKDLEKTIATKWKQYVSCKKATLKAGATSSAALGACVSGPDPNSIKLDSKGKIAKTVTKLGSDITKDCGSVTIGSAFPGGCSGSTTGTLAACLDVKAECRICLALNATDNLAVNCDLFDDGLANSSCAAPAGCVNSCPLAKGRYTLTTTGGALKVATFGAFPFPAGGTTKQDVDCGDVNCVHPTVIPFPGGLTVPVFCVPALGASTSVTQSGCGVGEIDSNGGSDFTITETGDTSTATGCAVLQGVCPAVGPAPDSSGRLDVTVGNASADTCASGGTANAITSIPVNTLTWVAADASCPDTDETFNPGTDTLLAQFPQTLDLTTDTSAAHFGELGTADGCTKSGLGPAGPYPPAALCVGAGNPYACCTALSTGATCTGAVGTCINTGTMTVSVAGSGTIFSSGGPTYDLLFETVNNDNVTGPAAFGGATCGSPPAINFTGTATRCIVAP